MMHVGHSKPRGSVRTLTRQRRFWISTPFPLGLLSYPTLAASSASIPCTRLPRRSSAYVAGKVN
jgi:hypothetical protein